jgi:hypothetical protein
MDIELHIFTNSTVNAPDTWHIETTYKSFCDTFKKEMPVTVWCDKNPNQEKAFEYIDALRKIFPVVNHEVGGLSHGYHLSVFNSKSEFLFMLEHDWQFYADRIPHTLDQIVDGMRKDNILHLRFNRKLHGNHPDGHASLGQDMDWVDYEGSVFPYSMVNMVSNNPHIINRERWLKEAAPHAHYVGFGKSYGLEEYLTASPIRGSIYGPRGHPPTILHTDGAVVETLRNVNLLN